MAPQWIREVQIKRDRTTTLCLTGLCKVHVVCTAKVLRGHRADRASCGRKRVLANAPRSGTHECTASESELILDQPPRPTGLIGTAPPWGIAVVADR